MITLGSLRIFLIALLMTIVDSRAGDALGDNQVHALADSNGIFATDLYGKLEATDGNLFFSPYSISGCLAMVYAGAQGNTARQLSQALHFDADAGQLASAFGELQRQLNAAEQKKGIELNVANGLWGQKGHPFLPAFLDIAKGSYQANLNQVDFRTEAEPARVTINDWVSGKTKGKITNLLQPGTVNASTRLVLVNAIYFKGKWARPFNKASTTNAPFSVTSSQRGQASLMNLKAEFKYATPEGLQLLELPYAGGDYSMVVLLPNDIDGLKALEKSLNEPALNSWLAQAHNQRVNVFLPKFKLTSMFQLAQTLAKMGMSDAFSGAADFSGMDGARDLSISEVVHKAFVDVNEEGTEAAAATGGIMRSSAIHLQPIPTFKADHPFIFLIRDTHSGSILFLGRLMDPAKE